MLNLLIGSIVFACIGVFVIYSSNLIISKQHQTVLQYFSNNNVLILQDVKTETFGSGTKNSNFYFNRCTLIATDEALIILGRLNLFKKLCTPIILTNNFLLYRSKFPFANIMKPNKTNLHSFNQDVYIEFENHGPMKTTIDLRVKGLTDEVKSKLYFLI